MCSSKKEITDGADKITLFTSLLGYKGIQEATIKKEKKVFQLVWWHNVDTVHVIFAVLI